jgi:hypothetical protein
VESYIYKVNFVVEKCGSLHWNVTGIGHIMFCTYGNVYRNTTMLITCGVRLQLKCDGTRWRREGKWRGNWRMEWLASTLHITSEHGVYSTTTADAHKLLGSSRLNWRSPQPSPAVDLNGLVRLVERRNLVSAHVPSHFNWSLPVTRSIKPYSANVENMGSL